MSLVANHPLGRTPRRLFIGDWPVIDPIAWWTSRGGIGPAMTTDICKACTRLIAASGECGCSE